MDAAVVSQIAPEVDRLVWAVGPSIPASARNTLTQAVDDAGLDGLGFLTNFNEFFLGAGLRRDVAFARQRYAPVDQLDAWLVSLVSAGLIEAADDRWTATPSGKALFTLVANAQNVSVSGLWPAHDEQVHQLLGLTAAVVDGAGDEHTVAVAHRSIPLPSSPPLALLRRLVTLRYLRQHDHIAAWERHGLTPQEIGILTELWHGGAVETSGPLEALVDRGLATLASTLTDEGARLREAIEEETNDRNARDFSVLTTDEQVSMLSALQALPPS